MESQGWKLFFRTNMWRNLVFDILAIHGLRSLQFSLRGIYWEIKGWLRGTIKYDLLLLLENAVKPVDKFEDHFRFRWKRFSSGRKQWFSNRMYSFSKSLQSFGFYPMIESQEIHEQFILDACRTIAGMDGYQISTLSRIRTLYFYYFISKNRLQFLNHSYACHRDNDRKKEIDQSA